MPKPIYIICAEAVCEDKGTNQISFFNVVERVLLDAAPQATPVPPTPAIALTLLKSVTVAVWSRQDGDDGQFESNFLIRLPNGDELNADTGPFSVSAVEDKPLHRFKLSLTLALPFVSGILTIASRLRPVGSNAAWLSQEYAIPIETRSESPDQGHPST